MAPRLLITRSRDDNCSQLPRYASQPSGISALLTIQARVARLRHRRNISNAGTKSLTHIAVSSRSLPATSQVPTPFRGGGLPPGHNRCQQLSSTTGQGTFRRRERRNKRSGVRLRDRRCQPGPGTGTPLGVRGMRRGGSYCRPENTPPLAHPSPWHGFSLASRARGDEGIDGMERR